MGKISVETDKVFRISLPDKDISSTDPLDFAVHSGFDYPKMEEDFVGYFSFTFPGSVSAGEYSIKTVTHNLGYMPMSLTFIGDVGGVPSDSFARLPINVYPYSAGSFLAYSTTTEFKIVANLVTPFDIAEVAGKTYNFKYQIWIND